METSASETQVMQSIDRFWETIPPIWGQIRGNIRAIAAENFDITFEQFHILRHVRSGVCSVSELAEVKHISRPAISQAVDLLVERGLLTRQQSAGDRRFFALALTPAGETMLDTIRQKNRAWMKEQLAGLSPADLEAISLGLDTLKKAFTEPD